MAIQKILKRLYIGDVESLMDSQRRKEYNIKTMICCAKEINPNLENIENFIYLPLNDSDWIRHEFIEDAIRFISRHIRHRPVLVSCAGGASRSASIILAYMISQGWDMNHAILHMRKIRPIINPHPLCLLSVRKYFNLPKW